MIIALASVTILLTSAKYSSANEIYMSQVGDDFTLAVDQKGNDNVVKGTTTTSAPVLGNNNNILLQQGYEGGNLVELDIDGDNNSVIARQERTATGGYDTNSLGNHSASIELTGDGNSVEIVQRNNNTSSAGHASNVRFRGDNNSLTTLQTGTGGANGHLSWVYTHTNESNNTVDIFQNSDTADHRAYVSIYTDNNAVDINQTGTTQNNAYVIFSSNTSGPTDFTLNQTGGDSYGNPDGSAAIISCGNIAGCSVTVNQ